MSKTSREVALSESWAPRCGCVLVSAQRMVTSLDKVLQREAQEVCAGMVGLSGKFIDPTRFSSFWEMQRHRQRQYTRR